MKHFIFAIDRSYSMYLIIDKVVHVVDKFIQQLKNDAFENSIDDIYISVIAFNNNLLYLAKLQNIKTFHNLSGNQFQVWGSTALYDTIHNIVNDYGINVQAEHHLYIITDGEDTESKKTKEDTNQLIQNAKTIGRWNIIMFNTEEISNLHIPVYTYNEDTIADLFENLRIK